jgi:hypothetical protein
MPEFDLSDLGEQQKKSAGGNLVIFGWHPVKDDVLTKGGEVPKDDVRVAIAKEKGISITKGKETGTLKIEAAGRDIFRDVEYVQIIIPGQRDIVHRPVEDRDRKEYAAQYRAFRENRDQDAASGTPLSTVTWLAKSMIEELRFFNCRTVEQLATMSDSDVSRFPGLREYQKKAQAFLEAAKGQAPLVRMQKELDERDSRIAALEKQVQDIVQKAAEKRRAAR